MQPQTKIARLRQQMQMAGIAAWIVPTADPHQSEYVAPCWQDRAWLSGFAGSAGTVVVTQQECGLWTDPRYHIRAAAELAGSGITLFRFGEADVPSYATWLRQQLAAGSVVGFDGSRLSIAAVRELREAFEGTQITLTARHNLLDAVWLDRPTLPSNPIFLHDDSFAGESRTAKFQRVREQLQQHGAQAQLVTALDEVAWLCNLRGSDVAYNPVAICYALITQEAVCLFIDPRKLSDAVRATLSAEKITFAPYETIFSIADYLPEAATVLLDPDQTNEALYQVVAQTQRVVLAQSVIGRLKAIKNSAELAGMRQAHRRDGVAVVKWWHWLLQQTDDVVHTELTVAEKLAEFRALGDHYRGLSFGTIAGFGVHSAIGHYQTDPHAPPMIGKRGLLLIDSGGHYLDGTTDITRTIALGTPTAAEKHVATTVLKALIRLSRARFPAKTTGAALDTLAREPLWQQGYNCRHGIGHGVGSFLNVHEGPQRLSPRNNVPFEAGMVCTIEPGVYFEGRFGVRLENVVLTQRAGESEFGQFYQFETVTLCPFDLTLVDESLLTAEERTWLTTYHQHVVNTLSPYLTASERAWLQHKVRQPQ